MNSSRISRQTDERSSPSKYFSLNTFLTHVFMLMMYKFSFQTQLNKNKNFISKNIMQKENFAIIFNLKSLMKQWKIF